MRNHKKEAQGIRRRQKTYSMYFKWVWTILIPVTITVILIGILCIKIKVELDQIWHKVNSESYRTDKLEKFHER